MPKPSPAPAAEHAAMPEQSRLGESAVTVPSMGVGTAALAVPYGAPGAERGAPARAEAVRTIEVALAHGLTFVDTAPAYGDAETIVGTACEGVDCVLASKLAIPARGWLEMEEADIEEHARRSLESSLRALRRDRLDLLQVHNTDVAVIAAGSLPSVLDRLRSEGLVRACGATVYGPHNAVAALECPVFDAVQVPFSALDRRVERILAPVVAAHGTAVIGRSVLLRGVLSPAGRSITGPLTPLRAAADQFRIAIGASWDELPGAAVAFVVSRRATACTLLGPRDSHELTELLDGAQNFAAAARGLEGDWDSGLPPALLDPSLWPEAG